MAAAVFCSGCGASVAVPEGYERNKIRCSACGVMVPVAAAAPSASAKKRASAPAPVSRAARTCAGCGQALPSGEADCPECSAAAALAGSTREERPRPMLPPAPAHQPAEEAPQRPAWAEGDDDGTPYEVRASDRERRCPACARVLEGTEVVCPGCDFDLVRGRPAIRVWPTVQRQWDSGLSPSLRWALFLTTVGLFLVGGAVGAVLTEDVCAFVGPSLLFAAMLAFLFGTWFRVEITRNPKGRVRIVRTTYVCFVARPPRVLRLGDFEGIVSGKVNEGRFYEWLLMLIFIPTVIGMVLWWYFIIHKDVFYVALSHDHGHPDEFVFRGWSEETMKDVEKVLRELAGFPA